MPRPRSERRCGGGLRSVLAIAAAGLSLLSASGCGRHAPAVQAPVATARRYLEHIARGELDAAYAFLDEGARSRCDRACFARMVSSQRLELERARLALLESGVRVEYRAEVAAPSEGGARLRMATPPRPSDEPGVGSAAAQETEKEKAAAKTGIARLVFVEDPLDFYPQDTPERALRAFLRALAAERYDVLLRFCPRGVLATLLPEGEPTSAETPAQRAAQKSAMVAELKRRFGGDGAARLRSQVEAVSKRLGEPMIREGDLARLPIGDGAEARLLLEEGTWRVERLN